jgi:tetratricopeptide (TPR) repeat protein
MALSLMTSNRPTFDRIAAILTALVIVGLMVFLLVRNEPIADPRLFFGLRIVLSLSAAILGASIPGFLNVRWSSGGLAVRAGGALALFVLTYVFTPDLVTDQGSKTGSITTKGPQSPVVQGTQGNVQMDLGTNPGTPEATPVAAQGAQQTQAPCSPVVTGTQRDVTVTFNGGCTIGMTPAQLKEIIDNIQAGRSIPSELLDHYDRLSRDFGVTDAALETFFRILGERKVAVTDLDAKLREIATKHLALLKKAEPLPSDDPAARARKEEAIAAINVGNYSLAEKLLVQAFDVELAAAKKAQNEANQCFLVAAETKADLGDLQAAQLQYDAAAVAFREAAELTPSTELLVRAEYLDQAGMMAIRAGLYSDATRDLSEALTLSEKALGPDAIELAPILNNLADAFHDQGRYPEAEPLHERALKIKEKVGAEDESLSTTLNNLAALYRDQGHYSKAERLYKRALAIREKVLGQEDPRVAHTLAGLANLYQVQGRFKEAEPLHERANAILEKLLGPRNPDLAIGLSDLATLYVRERRLPEAEPLFKRALEIYEATLGPDHPNNAITLNSLAILYFYEHRYNEAESLYTRALAIDGKMLEPGSPDLAQTINTGALIYEAEGRYTDAEPLYRRAIEIDEKALDPAHPNLVLHLNNLANMYIGQRRFAEAEPLLTRVLAIEEKRFGAGHQEIADCLDRLAAVYYLQRQYAEAEPLLRRAAAIDEKALGPNDPKTLQIREHMRQLMDASMHQKPDKS